MRDFGVYESKKFEDVESKLFERQDSDCPTCPNIVRKAWAQVNVYGFSPFVTTGSNTRFTTMDCTWQVVSIFTAPHETLYSATINLDPVGGFCTVSGTFPPGFEEYPPAGGNPYYNFDLSPIGVNGAEYFGYTADSGAYYPQTISSPGLSRTNTTYDFQIPVGSYTQKVNMVLSNPINFDTVAHDAIIPLAVSASNCLDSITDGKIIKWVKQTASGSYQNQYNITVSSSINDDGLRNALVNSRNVDSPIFFGNVGPFCGPVDFIFFRYYTDSDCVDSRPYYPTTASSYMADLTTFSDGRIGSNIYSPCGYPDGSGSFIITLDKYVFINSSTFNNRSNYYLQQCINTATNCYITVSGSACRPQSTASFCTASCI